MKNPLKKLTGTSKLKGAQALASELIEEIARLQEENKELRVENISLKIENNRLQKLVEGYHQAGVEIAHQVKRLRRENTALKARNNIIEHKEVINSEHGTQGNGSRAG